MLEVVRKGIRFPLQAFPSGSGEPPAEGAVAFSTFLWGWVGSMLRDLPFRGNLLDIPFQQTKAVAEECYDVAAFPPLKHLCALCVLCGSPPHAAPETFRCRPRGLQTDSC